MPWFQTFLDFEFHWLSRHVVLFDRVEIIILLKETTFQRWCDISDPAGAPHCQHGVAPGSACMLCDDLRK